MKSKKTHDEWKKLVLEFNKSSLAMKEFCQEIQVKPSTFIYWVKMFNKLEVKASKLVKLPINKIVDINPIQITINNIKLEILGDMATEKIAKLVSVIREVI